MMARQIESVDGDTILVNTDGLHSLSARPPLTDYLRQLWERRYFIWEDARSRAFKSTQAYRLWRTWLIVNPVLDVVLYGFLFGFLFKTHRGIDNFIGYLFLGIIFMKMLNGLISGGSGLMGSNASFIRAFNFPRASIPLSFAVRKMLDNLFPAGVAVVVSFLLQWGTFPRWTVVLIVPIYVLLHIFGCGLMMIIARISAQIPDVKPLVGLFTQALFFLSGVMYSLDRFAGNPEVQRIMANNPAYIFLTAVRDSTIYGTAPSYGTWATLLLWSFGTFVIGFVFFWQAEEKYLRII